MRRHANLRVHSSPGTQRGRLLVSKLRISRFRHDTTPPDTTITSGPSGTISTATPSFSFSSTESGSTFKCRFDSAAFAACSGPGATHTPASALPDGAHTFAVEAIDSSGNTDPTPASRSFTVSTGGGGTGGGCTNWQWNQNGYGSFSAANPPGACWRPFASSNSPSNPTASNLAESPFNGWAAGDSTLPNSSSAVNWLTNYGGTSRAAGPLLADDPMNDGVTPIYWESSSSNDPVYHLDCVSHPCNGGLDASGTVTTRIPPGAQPQGVWPHNPNYDSDAHMTIIDQSSNTEDELYHVTAIDNTTHTVTFDGGGVVRLDRRGLYSSGDNSYPGSVAAETATVAGVIRPEELDQGQINHAIAMQVPCVSGSPVWPAVHTGATCSDYGIDGTNAPAMGAHFRLDLTPAQQSSLQASLPAWKWTIVQALQRYGAYVTDTTGTAGSWGFQWENSKSYTSVGAPNQWDKFVADQGASRADCYHPVNDIEKCYYHTTPAGKSQYPNDVCDGGNGHLYNPSNNRVDMTSGGCYGAWWMQLSGNSGGASIPWGQLDEVQGVDYSPSP